MPGGSVLAPRTAGAPMDHKTRAAIINMSHDGFLSVQPHDFAQTDRKNKVDYATGRQA